jgi:hypothetical protein
VTISKYDVYIEFRKAQSMALNRPYRIPKDLDKHFETKMSPENNKQLEYLTNRFLTRWANIDVSRFFRYGFELFGKKFSYDRFIHPKLVLFYIEKDKNLKRNSENTKEKIVESVKFVKKWMKDKEIREDISLLSQYCMKRDDGIKAPVKHYLLGKIDKHFVTWLIYKKMLNVTVDEDGLLPYIEENYRDYVCDIENMSKFLKELESKI